MKELKKNMTNFNVMLAKEFDPMKRRLDIKNFIEMGVAGQPSVVVGPHFGPIT